MLNTFASIAVLVASCIFTGGALAQPYPSKPITIVVPFGAGGPVDAIARALGAELAADLKQPVLVDNRPGANQTIGGRLVAGAEPNGYTLMLQVVPNLIPPSLLKTLPYKGGTDFAAVAPVVRIGSLLAISTKVPAANLKEFLALLRANPGKYTYGTSGVGGPPHGWNEMLNFQLGTSSVHVPYKSYPEYVNQLVAGEIDYAFVAFGAMQFVTAGKLKVLGVAAATRDPDYPAIPTLDEQGLTLDGTQLYTVVTTKGTPPEIVQRLNAAITAATARESFRSKVRAIGGLQFPSASPAQTAEWIAHDEEVFGRLVKENRIKLE